MVKMARVCGPRWLEEVVVLAYSYLVSFQTPYEDIYIFWLKLPGNIREKKCSSTGKFFKYHYNGLFKEWEEPDKPRTSRNWPVKPVGHFPNFTYKTNIDFVKLPWNTFWNEAESTLHYPVSYLDTFRFGLTIVLRFVGRRQRSHGIQFTADTLAFPERRSVDTESGVEVAWCVQSVRPLLV